MIDLAGMGLDKDVSLITGCFGIMKGESNMILTGAQILIECLKEQGVDTIFGYPGGTILNIYDELYKHSDEIKHYRTSHEQGASHAADGYARATGKVGVCFATSGPGSTNLVTGIATAYMDSIPVVAITANVATNLIGKDSFQEVNITGITMPITKHNYAVLKVEDLADTIREAFYIAKSGRPGPVLIDIPKDVTANTCEYTPKEPLKVARDTKNIKDEDIENAVKLIKESSKPMIYIGGGVILSGSEKEVFEFAEKIDAPVCSSFMGLGGFPADNKRYTGMIGMHGTKTSNIATKDADLFIAIGARFSDRVISNPKLFAKNAKILHIDIDRSEVDKNIKTYFSVLGDAKEVLKILNKKVEKKDNAEWNKQVQEWKSEYPMKYKEEGLMPQYIIKCINEITKGEAIITTEVGQHQMWAAQYINHKVPRRFISSGGLGTMGFGLGAAIGAKLAFPERTVFNIAGDGSFRMNCNELTTAVENDIPIIVVVMNNHTLGMVRQWQSLFYDKRYSNTTMKKAFDVVKVAEGFNAVGITITKKEEVDDVIKKAIAMNKVVVINCEIATDIRVYPMVAPGASIVDTITE